MWQNFQYHGSLENSSMIILYLFFKVALTKWVFYQHTTQTIEQITLKFGKQITIMNDRSSKKVFSKIHPLKGWNRSLNFVRRNKTRLIF